MNKLSEGFLFTLGVILVGFGYVQGVVVPNTAVKYAQQAAINSYNSSLGNINVKSLQPCNSVVSKCGKIRVVENTNPDSYQDFTFNHNIAGYPSTFALDDDATPSLANSKVMVAADATTHTISQFPVTGFTTTVTCNDPSGGTTISGSTAYVAINSSESITCTFTNTPTVPVACPSNSWLQRANLGGLARSRSFGFSINNKGYIGGGLNTLSSLQEDFWEYNTTTNIWTQKANFGGGINSDSVAFAINGKGYVVTGADGVWSTNDTWEYNPTSNGWIQKADFGGVARFGAVGFAIGAKGYLGLGNDPITNNGVFLQDFWEYDPITDIWTQKSNFPGGLRHRAEGFSIGNKGYVGVGGNIVNNSTQLFQDFWEYNPTTDLWTQKANLPGLPRWDAASFSIGNKGYLGTGVPQGGGMLQDFWEYNPLNDTWTQKANLYGPARGRAVGFSIGSKGYIGTGFGGVFSLVHLNDFWEYCP